MVAKHIHYTQRVKNLLYLVVWVNKPVEGKVFPIHVNKTCRGNGGISPLVLNFGTKWRYVVNIPARPLEPQEIPPVPTGWAPEPVWRVRAEKNYFTLPEFF